MTAILGGPAGVDGAAAAGAGAEVTWAAALRAKAEASEATRISERFMRWLSSFEIPVWPSLIRRTPVPPEQHHGLISTPATTACRCGPRLLFGGLRGWGRGRKDADGNVSRN